MSLPEQAAPERVTVVGLGYVGLPLAVALAQSGQYVHGVDLNPVVRAAVGRRQAPVLEPGLGAALRELPEGALTVHSSLSGLPLSTVIVCVGTAVDLATHEPDLSALRAAVSAIAAEMTEDTLVIIRSTVPIGTCRNLVIPILSERVADPRVAFCPERIIQGRALEELRSLPQVIGGVDERAGRRAAEVLAPVVRATVAVSSLEAAEAIKLLCNAHTDVLYGFGNEVARIAVALGLDADELIRGANAGYPRPDLARPGYVGGSCLVKDPYMLITGAEKAGYRPSLIAAARSLNEGIPRNVADRVMAALAAAGRSDQAKVLVCGVAYKGHPPTDDVRGGAAEILSVILRDRVATLAAHDYRVQAGVIAGMGFKPVSLDDGLAEADAVIVLIDQPRYAELTAERIKASMRRPAVVFDMWGVLDEGLAREADVTYLRLGHG